MKWLFYNGLCICLMLYSCVLVAQQPERDLSMEIFEKSGLASQIKLLPDTLSRRFHYELKHDSALDELSEDMAKQYIAQLRSSFAVEKLTHSILVYLDNSFSYREMEQVIHWLESADGSQFTRMETLATRPETIVEMRQFDINNQSRVLPFSRRQLISRLNKVTRASDSTLVIMLTSRLAIELIKQRQSNAERPLSVVEVMKQIGKQRDDLEKEALPDVIAGLHYTYRNASNEAIQAYIHFAETNLGKRYHNAILGAYNSSLIDASQAFGKEIISGIPAAN